MNSLKTLINPVKILTFALSFIIFCFSISVPNAFAALRIAQVARITGGELSVNVNAPSLPAKTVIRSAKLYLDDGETGTINKIQITGSNGIEFGCQDIKVKNGINLIKACGGPAVLETGGTLSYLAKGSGFGPEPDTDLVVVLSDDF